MVAHPAETGPIQNPVWYRLVQARIIENTGFYRFAGGQSIRSAAAVMTPSKGRIRVGLGFQLVDQNSLERKGM